MGHRGRTSTASLSVIPPADVLEQGRAKPPAHLTPEQAVEWAAIAQRMPADWFPRETHGLLADYCRHVVRSRKIAKLIDQLDRKREVDVDEYDKLCRMADRESRIIASLANRMRISQSSRYDKKKSRGPTARRPWQE